MNLQQQPNPWSCLATSFAMCLNIPVKEFIEIIGHDASKVLWPSVSDERYNRAGHHIQECIDVAYQLGYLCVCIDAKPTFKHFIPDIQESPEVWSEDKCSKRLEVYMKYFVGVLVGKVGFNVGHAVAWDGTKVYDPRGSIIELKDFEFGCEHFYLVKRVY